MSTQRLDITDPRISPAIEDLKQLIRIRYPEASFSVFEGEDPEGVYLKAVVDIDDSSDVMETVLDKLYQLQVEQELPVYVVTSQPAARVAAQLQARGTQPRPSLSQLAG